MAQRKGAQKTTARQSGSSSGAKRRKTPAAQQPATRRATGANRTAATRAASAGSRGGSAARTQRMPQSVPEQQTRPAFETPTSSIGSQARHDIAGIVMGVVGVALLVSVLTPTTGVLTAAVSRFLHLALGVCAPLVPIALILWALAFFVPSNRIVPGRAAAGLGLIALSFVSLVGITTPGAPSDPSLLFTETVLCNRGGYVGNSIGWMFLHLTGLTVGIIVLVGVLVAGLVVIGFSASDLIQSARLRARERREFARRDRQEREEQRRREEARQQELLWQSSLDERGGSQRYAPTALFDPHEPVVDSRSRSVFDETEIPASVLAHASSHRSSSSRDRSIRTFGCGTQPQVNGDVDPNDLEDSYTPETASGAGSSSLDGMTSEPAASSNSFASAGETTFIQPPTDDYDLDRTVFPGLSTKISSEKAVAPIRQGVDVPFDARESLDQRTTLRDRVRQRREESLSRQWWEDGDQPHEDDDPRDDAYSANLIDVPVPGVILGAPTSLSRTPSQTASSVEGSSSDAMPASETPLQTDASLKTDASLTSSFDKTASEMTPPWEDVPASVSESVAAVGVPASVAQRAKRRSSSQTASASQPSSQEQTGWDSIARGRIPSDAAVHRAEAGDSAPGEEMAPAQATGGVQVTPVASSSEEPFVLPSPSILRRNPQGLKKSEAEQREIEMMGKRLAQTLDEFKVPGKVMGWIEGPTCTTYEVQPGEGVRVSKFTSLEDDISRTLARESVRIYSPVHGTPYVGIEVPNTTRQTVLFGDVLPAVTGGPLDIAVGLDADGKPVHVDLATLPHLLIAGTTGSGKSVMVNSIICSLLMRDTPEDVRLIMVDPKQVELTGYNGIPHLVMPVVSDTRQAAAALQWGVTEMERRYKLFANLGVRQLTKYNQLVETSSQDDREFPLKHLPYIVIIIDELTDLMMVAKKDVEASIVRIAQLGRAAGIHIVMATQRPSANVVTGLIKANVDNRMGLKVSSNVDSRVILDQPGAEKLLGHGDMLFLQTKWGDKPRRIQGCYLSDPEIANIVKSLKGQSMPDDAGMAPIGAGSQLTLDGALSDSSGGEHENSANDDDPLVLKAAQLVVENQLGSTSMIQRRLKLGYARAGRVMDMLEELGVVGPARSSKPRDVLVHDLDELSTLFGQDITEEDA